MLDRHPACDRRRRTPRRTPRPTGSTSATADRASVKPPSSSNHGGTDRSSSVRRRSRPRERAPAGGAEVELDRVAEEVARASAAAHAQSMPIVASATPSSASRARSSSRRERSTSAPGTTMPRRGVFGRGRGIRRPSQERRAGPQLARVVERRGDRLCRSARRGRSVPGKPRSSTSPYGRATTPSGRRSICIVGISTSNGPARSHRRDAMLTAEPM